MDDSLVSSLIHSVVRTGILPEHTDQVLEELMPRMPKDGPLSDYRRAASFDWRAMKLVIESEEVIRFRNRIFHTLENDPIFAHRPDQELTREEKRELTFTRFKRLMEYNLLPDEEFMS